MRRPAMFACLALLALSYASVGIADSCLFEDESCGESLNGGCDALPLVFDHVDCGTRVCGSSWASNGVRDTDWYNFVVTEDGTEIIAALDSDFPGVIYILGGVEACDPFVHGQPGYAESGASVVPASAILDAGTYVIYVAPFNFRGVQCGVNGSYAFTLDCAMPEPECGWDLDGSGDVGSADLAQLLSWWGNPYDIEDLAAMLADWGCGDSGA